MIIKVYSCFSGRVELNPCLSIFRVLEKEKTFSNANQQAEGKTHFDRLSSETDWTCKTPLDFLEALSPKSPFWSSVPSMYQDQDFCRVTFLFSLHRLWRHQVQGEKKPLFILILTFAWVWKAKRNKPGLLFYCALFQIPIIFPWIPWTQASVLALHLHSGSMMCVRHYMTFFLEEWKINIARYVEGIP